MPKATKPGDTSYWNKPDRFPTGKPGDLSRLKRTDPLLRDAYNLPRGSGPNQTPAETRENIKNFNESGRREFRQFEDRDSGDWMNNASHHVIDGSENKG